MARTPRTFSRRGHAEAKAGENIGQGKPGKAVTETKYGSWDRTLDVCAKRRSER